MPFVDLATQRLDPAAVNSVPEHVARKHKVLAIGKNGSRLIVAVVNPNDPFAMQDIRVTSGVQQIAMGLATEDDMMDALDRAYKSNGGGGGGAEAISLPNTPGHASMGGGGPGGMALSAEVRQAIAGYGAREEISDEDTETLAKVVRRSADYPNRLHHYPAGDQGRRQ